MIKYQGSFYIRAEPPPGQGTSNPTNMMKSLNQDQGERKPTQIEPEKKPEPIPYDPRVSRVKSKLESRRSRLVKLRFPLKELTDLVERYQLPSAQIFIRDIATTKVRLLQSLDQVISDLEKLTTEEDQEQTTS